MRRVVYSVAASLDGYIAGPGGEFDWIPMDPDVDFAALMGRFDTLLMGRRTFEVMAAQGGEAPDPAPGTKTIVASRTLRQEDHPEVTIVSEGLEEAVSRLREEPGKDVWLFGGGSLFGSLLDAGLVDAVEVAVVPILLGGGIPLLPHPAGRARLRLTGSRVYEKSGIVLLEYAVEAAA